MADGGIVIEMSSEESKLWRGFQSIIAQQTKMEGGLQKVGAAGNKAAAEQRKLEQAAKRVYEQTRSPQERYAAKMQQLNMLVGRGKISQDTYARATRQATEQMRAAGQAGTNAFGPKMMGMVTGLIGALGLGGGVAGAVMKINQAYEVWLENMREISAEAKRAGDDIIAFAALQEGGTKGQRVMDAAMLAARYGISDRGAAFNAVQALQSAHGGDIEKGMAAAETVFAAKQVGVPTEMGLELEVLGASQGMKPGDALRMAYVAGQESARDPATLAGGAAGLKFWEDKQFGFAAAGVLAGSVKKDQLSTYLKRGGQALSRVGPEGAAKRFEAAGLGDAGQAERLKYLAAEGIDTAEKLKQFGFTEIHQVEALTALVPNYQNVLRIQQTIGRKARPGLLAEQRRAVEEELPFTKTTRQIGQLDVMFADEQAFGAGKDAALAQERRQATRAIAFERMGKRQSLWFDLIKRGEEGGGRSTEADVAQYLFGETAKGMAGGGGRAAQGLGAGLPGGLGLLLRGGAGLWRGVGASRELAAETGKIEAELSSNDPLVQTSQEQTNLLKQIAANTASGNAPPGGNATLVPATVDK